MTTCIRLLSGIIIGVLAAVPLAAGDKDPQQGAILQFGRMHEAIGQQRHEGRVRFSELLRKPHFFGVAALEGLQGEATIYDGELTVTTVDANGRLRRIEDPDPDTQATLLVGSYISGWTDHAVTKDIETEEVDVHIANVAEKAGMNVNVPFLFTVEGTFTDVRLHVINGACPIRARMKKEEVPKDVQPFESEMQEIGGRLVGVFAKDAVGNLTHPATSTHTHLVFKDPTSGKTVTGHVEQIGLRKGAVLRLPQ